MCGIAGLLTKSRLDEALVCRLIKPLEHRGPDGEGVWLDPEAGIGFGHRRLAVVDLSPAGAQPMLSADGRLVLNFNGEIYNHAELRAALEAVGAVPEGGWHGHSDTEALLQAIAHWGLEHALERSVGMFAFALWDREARTLRLVRDRFGEKPLYYGWVGGDFLFASELKAMRAHPGFNNDIDRKALGQFAARTYVPAPRSIYRRIYKLEPGCILRVGQNAVTSPTDQAPKPDARAANGLSLTRYWSYREVVRDGLADPIEDEATALDALEEALAAAVRGQSVADVPVGAFLSGGIDSSTITAIYQKYSNIPVRTFTIGFEELGFNEAVHANAVAEHLGTVHHELYVTVQEARDVIPLLPAMYDEPFADSSQIPTYLVSRFAREQVTVALTGDGGDELFGGYNRHFLAPRLWSRLNRIPRPVRALLTLPMARVSPRFWAATAGLVSPGRELEVGLKMRKGFSLAANARTFDQLMATLLDEWALSPTVVVDGDPATPSLDMDVGANASDSVRAMYYDAISYLPDDILCKVDRASMASSLETRVPFLDHRVARLAARIPISHKIAGSRGKLILRKLLNRHLPEQLFDRPKAGFGIPIGGWLRGPLRDWAEDLLAPRRMAEDGWFDAEMVSHRWKEHVSGRVDSTQAMWAILTFQAWLRGQN